MSAERRARNGAAERDGDGAGEDQSLRRAAGGEPDVRIGAARMAGGAVDEGGVELLCGEEVGLEIVVCLRRNALVALGSLHGLVDVGRALPRRRRFVVPGLLGV